MSFAISLFSSTLSIKLSKRWKKNVRVTKNYVLIQGSEKQIVAGLKITSIDPLLLKKDLCHAIKEYSRAFASCCPDVVLEVRVRRKYVSKEKVMAKLSREITALKVILQEDPSNKHIERKLRRLEHLFSALQKGSLPSEVEFNVLFISEEFTKLERSMEIMKDKLESILNADVSRLSGREILSIMMFKGMKRELTTSDLMAFSFLVPRAPKLGPILLGKDVLTGELVMLDENDLLHHIGVFGSTGSGKSTTLATIAKRVSALMDVDVIVFDPKGDLIELLKDDEVTTFGPIVASSIDERKREVEEEFERNVLRRILNSKVSNRLNTLLIIDEAWLLSSNALELAIREGRSRGVGVVVATQSVNDLKPQLLTNLRTLLLMRHNVEDVSDKLRHLLGEYADDLPYLRTGEAVFIKDIDVRKVIIEPELDIYKHDLEVQGVEAGN